MRSMKQRAMGSEDKAARRADILAAARALYRQNSYQLPSVAQIATASGLAKGTVYLYFRTKEEIFVALLAEDFTGLLNEVERHFSTPSSAGSLDAFLSDYMAYLKHHPELLRLDAMAYSVLEQNLDIEQMRAFKLGLTQQLVATGAIIERAFALPEGRGTSLLMRTYALTRGLWQTLDYPPCMSELLAAPEFAPIRPPFLTELPQALAEYWRGALQAP